MPPRRTRKPSRQSPPPPPPPVAYSSDGRGRDVKIPMQRKGRPAAAAAASTSRSTSDSDSDDTEEEDADETVADGGGGDDDETEERFEDDRDDLVRHLVESEGRRVKRRVARPRPAVGAPTCADRLLAWIDPFEFIVAGVLAILIFTLLQTTPHAWMETPGGFWFLSLSIVWHMVGTTYRIRPSLFLAIINVLLDVLMIVFLSLKRLWDTGDDLDAQRIRDNADYAIAIYAVLFLCSFVRLLLFLKLCVCCSVSPPRVRHVRL